MNGAMDGTTWGYVVSALITGSFGVLIAWQNYKLAKKTRTNHGRTIGQHVEDAASDSAEAKLAVQLVALQLQEYKVSQQAQHDIEQKTLEQYVKADAEAHAELRSLVVLAAAAAGKPPIA